MSAYLIVTIEELSNPAAFEEYGKSTRPAHAKYHGRFLALRTKTTVVEGEPKVGAALIEFPSYDDALAFYNSPEYQTAKKKREGAAKCTFIVTEGLPASGVIPPAS